MEQCKSGLCGEKHVSVIDEKGFREGVGIIVANNCGQVLWARRIGQHAWQFPQGGLQPGETPQQALFRELYEELGLKGSDVELLGSTKNCLYYWLPTHFQRSHAQPLCIGQKQTWFLLRLIGGTEKICFNVTRSPEFDRWRWVSYWYPIKHVITFKRHVYRRALEELSTLLPVDIVQLRREHRAANGSTLVEKVE